MCIEQIYLNEHWANQSQWEIYLNEKSISMCIEQIYLNEHWAFSPGLRSASTTCCSSHPGVKQIQYIYVSPIFPKLSQVTLWGSQWRRICVKTCLSCAFFMSPYVTLLKIAPCDVDVTQNCNKRGISLMLRVSLLGKTSTQKTFTFGHCPNCLNSPIPPIWAIWSTFFQTSMFCA